MASSGKCSSVREAYTAGMTLLEYSVIMHCLSWTAFGRPSMDAKLTQLSGHL